MADYRAIAGVSSSLRTLLRDRMEQQVDVTIAPPDVTVTGATGRRLNLYLYQVTENGYLKNQEIPGQGHPGTYGHPPLSLDLHYLLTAHGTSETAADSDVEAQQILGDAMRVVHDFAIVWDELQITSPSVGTVGDPILDPSLRNEFEKVKITSQPLSLEDLSKIWTALPQANFRRSVAYQVSVVQIESGRPRRFALPVTARRVHVAPLRRPQITAVYRTPAAGEPIGDLRVRIGQQITIEGRNFLSQATSVRLGDLPPIPVTPASDERIQITVPNDVLLQPGPQLVSVLAERADEFVEGGLDRGTLVLGTQVQESNQAVFMLVPSVTSINPATGTSAALLTVNGTRLFREGLKSFVLVGDVAIEVRRPGPGDLWAAPTATSVQVPLTAVSTVVPPLAPDEYLVRVMVNGALSTEESHLFTLA